MKDKNAFIVFSLIVLVLFFGIKGIILAASYLIPLTFAVLLTLITIPLARKFEQFGLSRGLASFSCLLLAILVYLSFFFLISVQGHNIAEKWPEMKEQIQPKFEKALSQIEEKTGLDLQSQLPGSQEIPEDSEQENQDTKETEESGGQSEIPGQLVPFAMNIFSFFGSSVLIFVYLFFFLSFRKKVKQSILLFFEKEKRNTVEKVLDESSDLALNFLGGRLLLILFLAVIYSIGLTIAGVENAILISLMAAIFSLVPFLGVWIGFTMAITFTLIGGGNTSSLIIVAATYFIAQFVESYILEPYVVGDKVNLNPLMTILVVVAGGVIWGVAGMVLSIPIVGILKIIFDAIEPLKPLGYLLGGEDIKESKEPGRLEKWGKSMWEKVSGK